LLINVLKFYSNLEWESTKIKLAVVLSAHTAQFEAVAFKGDFEANVARVAGYAYHGVEQVGADNFYRRAANHCVFAGI
jgi:hypothetical protein